MIAVLADTGPTGDLQLAPPQQPLQACQGKTLLVFRQ